jgi:hypothetical protein
VRYKARLEIYVINVLFYQFQIVRGATYFFAHYFNVSDFHFLKTFSCLSFLLVLRLSFCLPNCCLYELLEEVELS